MPADYSDLLPQPDDDTSAYWEAAKAHELRIQQCTECKAFRHPPHKTCPNCLSELSVWIRVSGRGRIYSHIRVFHTVLGEWRDSVPYNIVQVELEEDPRVRILGNVVGMDDTQLKVGMPVKVVFDDVTSDVTIPRWAPA